MTTSNGGAGRRRWLGILVVVSGLLILWGWYYREPAVLGEVGSQFALSLLAACNQNDLERIERLEETLTEIESNAAASKGEIRSLKVIVNHAKRGRWDAAQRDARALLESQARENDDLPDLK